MSSWKPSLTQVDKRNSGCQCEELKKMKSSEKNRESSFVFMTAVCLSHPSWLRSFDCIMKE